MNEHEHQPRRSLFRWILRGLYIITPAFVGVPVVAVVQHQGSNNVDLIAAFGLLGWMLLLTADLVFRWRDFVSLVLGSPLSLGLFGGMLELPSNPLHISGGPCGGPTIILVLGLRRLCCFSASWSGSLVPSSVPTCGSFKKGRGPSDD